MKISIKSKFVVVTLVTASALNLVGCGGSGVAPAAGVEMPYGIYVANGTASNVKFTPDISNSTEKKFSTNSKAPVTSVNVFEDKLYFGLKNGILSCANANNSQVVNYDGGPGTEFGSIHSIVVDKIGRIYVADGDHQRIVRINNISGAGYTVLNLVPFSTGVNDAGSSIAIDSKDRIYVVCRAQKKILRFNSMSDAAPTSFAALDPSKFNPDMSGFDNPYDICIDKSDHIYVTDRNHYRICRFDDMSGFNWKTFGTVGNSGAGKFGDITDISVDTLGNIYVIDPGLDHIVRISDMNGTGWTTFGSIGAGVGQYTEMNDILVR